MIQRAPRQEGKTEIKISPESSTDILHTLWAVEHDPELNKHANMYTFKEEYKARGIDLEGEFAKRAKSSHGEAIQNTFLANKHNSFAASLAETLPLYANKKGRLGEYVQANVVKTAKPDDQGNSFIDLVLEVKNTWLATDAPKSMQDVPAKMTFLIDVTTADGGQKYENKLNSLKDAFLVRGQKANVLCYKNEFGDLGIDRPKIVVQQSADNLEKLGGKLGTSITKLAADSFSINKPDMFDKTYREYFLDLMTAIGENAASNFAYLKSLEPDTKRDMLAKEYEKIVKFIEAYKKTPVTKERKSAA